MREGRKVQRVSCSVRHYYFGTFSAIASKSGYIALNENAGVVPFLCNRKYNRVVYEAH